MANELNTIYLGNRGEDFREFIRSLLDQADLKPKYKDLLLDDESMKIYGVAFTSLTADPEKSYEAFEQLGDVSANKFIVWYMYRRFPQLNCASGVKVVARLRINYGAKEMFSRIAQTLGFWPFISSSDEQRGREKKNLEEDTFEAFIGATEWLLDTRIYMGVGFPIIYTILKSIFDNIDVSLRYDDLYDHKTRLKELFDYYKEKVGGLKYEEEKREKGDRFAISRVYRIINGRGPQRIQGGEKILIGTGQASLKADAEQLAAAEGLGTLNNQGYIKPIPSEYEMFCS
jgi:dsRNA-specific ribonuclease